MISQRSNNPFKQNLIPKESSTQASKKMKKQFIFVLMKLTFLTFLILNVMGLSDLTAQKNNIDTSGTMVVSLPTVVVVDNFLSEADRQEYLETLLNFEKLKRAVEKVYPLAKACSNILNEVNSDIAQAKNESDRKKYMKKLEKELFKKYEKQIRSLTVSQGKILIKLINRECGASAFKLIDEYKSTAAAGFWQIVAKMFGTNLKEEYNRSKETSIESIIRAIDSGNSNAWTVTKH